MVRSPRRRSGSRTGRAVVVAGFSVLAGCSRILGLDQGLPLVDESDASSDGTVPPIAAEAGDEIANVGPDFEEAATPSPAVEASIPEAGGRDDAPHDAGMEAGCTPDPEWCDMHCGNGPDNCGAKRQCPTCQMGETCSASYQCKCQPDPNWCMGRCGATTDNCNNAIDCGTCGPTPCTAESMQLACGSRQCGTAVNNCNQTVNCGLFGILSTCTNSNQVCLANGMCCTPNSGAACGNQCGTFVTDNCGRSVQCPTSCASGLVCYQGTCCTPNDPCAGACGVSRVNSCGQTVQCGCSAGNAECVTATSTCCVPQGCSANCVDSCGLPAASCCVDAGPDSGPPEPDAGDDADADDTEASPEGAGDAATE